MRRLTCLFALLPILGSGLRADWKIVTRTGDTRVTEYFKGALMRTDSLPAHTSVLDYDHRRQVDWRTDLRQYVILEWPPPTPLSDSAPGPVILVERITKDTGERKSFFGRPARHFVTRMTHTSGPETVIDGWYVEAPGLPQSKIGANGSFAILVGFAQGQSPPRIQAKQTGPAPEGLPVWLRTTSSMALPDGSRHTDETVSEVTELVEGALPDRLFQPPDGYQRVGSFPDVPQNRHAPTWAELLQAHWKMVEDWLSGLFGARPNG